MPGSDAHQRAREHPCPTPPAEAADGRLVISMLYHSTNLYTAQAETIVSANLIRWRLNNYQMSEETMIRIVDRFVVTDHDCLARG
jgi:hypothetical protein